MSTPRHTPPRRRPATALPRWLRPKLDAATRRELTLAQHVNVDTIAAGTATLTLLHEWADGLLMFSRIAEKLGRGMPEITAQLELAARVVERCTNTGRIEFADAAELELARDGLIVQELLAAECDEQTGLDAAKWSAQVRDRIEAQRGKGAA